MTTKRGYETFKPWLDYALAVVLLLISAPIIVLSAVLVRLNSRGSWIYAQKRLGLKGKVFTIYKIRTMYQDSEKPVRPDLVGPRRSPGHPGRPVPALEPH